MSRLVLLLVMVVALSGCGKREGHSPGAEPETVSLYQEGKGVFLPQEMKEKLGIALAEVEAKQLRIEFQRIGQVFRAANDEQLAQASVLVDAERAGTLQIGSEVKLKSDRDEGAGKVSAIDRQAQMALGQCEVVVTFRDTDRKHPAGSFLTAMFELPQTAAAVVLPASAVLTAADGEFAYVVNGNYLTRTKIKTGAVADGFVEVKDGLYSGDSVVAKGMKELWLIELQATKTGKPCCVVAKK